MSTFIVSYHTAGALISTKEYFYNKQSQLVEIKVDNVTTDTYNATGAVLTHNNEVYAYDEWDRLSSFTNSSGVTTEYKYDINGIRTAKSANGTSTQYVVDIISN